MAIADRVANAAARGYMAARGGTRVYRTGPTGPRMELDTTASPMMALRRFGVYELRVRRWLRSQLNRGDTFIDVGANQGYHTLRAARDVGPDGRVVAVEPHTPNAESVARNARLNGYGHVSVYAGALSDRDGEEQLIIGPTSGWHSLERAEPLGDGRKTEPVPARTFGSLLSKYDIPPADVSAVKVDVQGAESAVLDGMAEFVDRADDCLVVVERHDHGPPVDVSEWPAARDRRGGWDVIHL